MSPSPWVLRRPAARARLRLVCFAYAGGNAAAFLPWQGAIDAGVEICAIQLPGRGARLAEAPIASMPELVKALAPEIARLGDLPCAFFGHSLGGLVAFEVARWCKLSYAPQPIHLFVSGCAAPQLRQPSEALHLLPDAALIDRLARYKGTPPEVLAHRELMQVLLPAIRADFRLVEEYRYRSGLPLTVPITVLAGRADEHVSAEQAAGWARETQGACRLRWFDGDHFFLHTERDAVLECIRAELDEARRAQAVPAALLADALGRGRRTES